MHGDFLVTFAAILGFHGSRRYSEDCVGLTVTGIREEGDSLTA